MAQSWRVRVGKKLSKPYTVTQLQKKYAQGLLKENTKCTVDSGESFLRLDLVLSDNAASTSLVPSENAAVASAESGDQVPQATAKSALPGPSRASRMPLKKLNREKPNGSEKVSQPFSQRFFDENPPPVTGHRVVDDAAVDDESGDTYEIPKPPSIGSSPPREFLEPKPSPIALAAAAALKSQEDSDGQQADSSRTQSRPVPPRPAMRQAAAIDKDEDDVIDESADRGGFNQHIRKIATVAVVLIGIAASATLALWYRDGGSPPTFEDLTGGAVAINTFRFDDPVTLEEVHARTQILGIQVSRLTKALVDSNGAATDATTPVEMLELPTAAPSIPLVGFVQQVLSSEERANVDNARRRYTQLVNASGPDGRQLDDATVTLYTQHLALLAGAVNATSPNRVTALYELSEWVKLTYLLQLNQVQSPDSAENDLAAAHILGCGNAGLERLYPELAAGDMRFNEIFQAVSPSEKSGLLLTRYWYHRSHDRATADQWLTAIMKTIDASEHKKIRAAIAEVDAIQG